MSKKGLSLEEKRTRMLDLFKETKEFYKLQELEKLAPKTKGITAMTVKEVLQGLVDDGLVRCEKVGIMNLYWHFPSDAAALVLSRHTKLKDSVEGLRARAVAEQKVIASEMVGREDTVERAELLERLDAARAQLQLLKEEESKHTGLDPSMFAAKEKQLKAIALQHTENVSAFLCYIRDQAGVEARDNLRAQYNIDEEWEDLTFA